MNSSARRLLSGACASTPLSSAQSHARFSSDIVADRSICGPTEAILHELSNEKLAAAVELNSAEWLRLVAYFALKMLSRMTSLLFQSKAMVMANGTSTSTSRNQ